MNATEFTAFLGQAFRNLAGFSIDGALRYTCMDWQHLDELRAAGRDAYGEWRTRCRPELQPKAGTHDCP